MISALTPATLTLAFGVYQRAFSDRRQEKSDQRSGRTLRPLEGSRRITQRITNALSSAARRHSHYFMPRAHDMTPHVILSAFEKMVATPALIKMHFSGRCYREYFAETLG
jgi:hypothetical protein